jgi:hypothetical protein
MIYPSFEMYLSLLPAEFLFKHFIARSGPKRQILSSSLVHDAVKRFASEESLQERFEGLSPEARRTCALAYLFGRKGVPAPAIKSLDDELLSSFLVFAGRDSDGKTGYYPFEELEGKLAPYCANVISQMAKTEDPKDPNRALPWYCLSDVVICANLAAQGLIEKTKKGVFSKAAETVFNRFLHAAHEMPQLKKSSDTGEENPCVALLLSYAVSRELLTFSDNIYRSAPKKLVEWLSLPLLERYSDFCEFAFETVPLWRRPVIEAVFGGEAGTIWLSTQAFPEALKKEAACAVSLLWYCGYLDARKEDGGLVFSLAPRRDIEGLLAALPPGRIRVLPDFSALLSQEVLPEELYWFSKAGALVSYDRVYKGMIRRDIINNSMGEGSNENMLVEWLISKNAPHNVVETVKEWVREFSRIYLTENSAVLSFDEKVTRQLLAYEPLRKLVRLVQPHSVFTIEQGHEAEVNGILVSMGFDPREPGGRAAEKRHKGIELTEGPEPAIMPLVTFDPESENAQRSVKAGKYGEKLKELDLGDMLHVLDYAVLMGQVVAFEYAGSPYVKAGMYKVNPVAVHKTGEPYFEADVLPKKAKKKFLLRMIKRIGVESA